MTATRSNMIPKRCKTGTKMQGDYIKDHKRLQKQLKMRHKEAEPQSAVKMITTRESSRELQNEHKKIQNGKRLIICLVLGCFKRVGASAGTPLSYEPKGVKVNRWDTFLLVSSLCLNR